MTKGDPKRVGALGAPFIFILLSMLSFVFNERFAISIF